MLKVNNKDTRTTPMVLIMPLLKNKAFARCAKRTLDAAK